MSKRGSRKATASSGSRRALWCALEALEPRRLLSTTIATPAITGASKTATVEGLSPAQVLAVYGFNTSGASIGAVGGDGSGQTIAIVEAYHSPTLAADVQHFDQQFGLPALPSLTEVNQTGGTTLPATSSSWAVETSLDVEWAHAVAPGANIVVVEAKSAQLSDLLTAVNVARNFSNVSVVSMSWGVEEFPTETTYDDLFTTPAGHGNVTFVASSGDMATASGVQWPAASPNVVSVGGTTLTLNSPPASGATETTFSGAISGVSKYEAVPNYQDADGSTATGRTTPDVVYNANPNPGFSVYDSSQGGWQTLGGTSAGAPQWAALVAVADQARALAGLPPLDGATQTLPEIYQYFTTTQQNATVAITTLSGGLASVANTYDGPAEKATPAAKVVKTTIDAPVLALTNSTGAPQATQVITALAATGSSNGSASATTPSAKVKHKHPVPNLAVHLFAIGGPPRPVSFSLTTSAPAPAIADGLLLQSSKLIGPVASTGAIGTTIGHASILSTAGPSILTEALADVTNIEFEALRKSVAALNFSIAAVCENAVAPVGKEWVVYDRAIGSFFIAHFEIPGATDAIARFIDECVAGRRSLVTDADAAHGHTRAWMVTVGVMALDAIVLAYLVSRRSRKQASETYVRWWEEPTPEFGV